MPEAEIDVTADLVAELIREQHPDLTGRLQMIANGWDNVIFRLGQTRTVRLPRRELAAALITKEQRWLSGLAALLPVAVPVPERIGTPTDDYPWFWSIGPWFDGDALTTLAVADRTRFAADLAEFFAALHQPAPADAPTNPVRGIPLAERDTLVRQHFEVLDVPDGLRSLWDELARTPPHPGPPAWVHGDPHPANVLIKADRLIAVIDFGDLCAGDPATDLAVGWLAFDRIGRGRFQDRYREIHGNDVDLWHRARAWALSLGLSLVANSDDNPMLAAIGSHALEQVERG